MRQIVFRAVSGEADVRRAEAMKRATIVAAMGDEALWEVFFPPHRTYATWVEQLQMREPGAVVLVELDGVVAGHMEMSVQDRNQESGSQVAKGLGEKVGVLHNIYLEPEFRGKGLGKVLDGHAMAVFKRWGVEKAVLRTNPLNGRLMAAYERLGWEKVGDGKHGMVELGKAVVQGEGIW